MDIYGYHMAGDRVELFRKGNKCSSIAFSEIQQLSRCKCVVRVLMKNGEDIRIRTTETWKLFRDLRNMLNIIKGDD